MVFQQLPIHNYDIVIGPIADDAIGTQIRLLTKLYYFGCIPGQD